MSDPIERQDVIDEAEKWIEAYNSGRGGQRERDAIKHVISGIKKLPSAQPEIVQCEDCQHWKQETFNDGYCIEMDLRMCDADFYCGYAERRTDE